MTIFDWYVAEKHWLYRYGSKKLVTYFDWSLIIGSMDVTPEYDKNIDGDKTAAIV